MRFVNMCYDFSNPIESNLCGLVFNNNKDNCLKIFDTTLLIVHILSMVYDLIVFHKYF